VEFIFTRGQLKKMSNQRHVSEFAELDGGILEKKITRMQIKPKIL